MEVALGMEVEMGSDGKGIMGDETNKNSVKQCMYD